MLPAERGAERVGVSGWRFAVGVGALMALFACRSAKVGDACSGENVCTGPESALVCVSGKYAAAECRGPDGCRKSPFSCDFRESADGSPCYESRAPAAPMSCSGDRKARVRCFKDKVEREACEGPQGCFPKGETTMGCDRALRAGAACTQDGDWCSGDGSDWLQCREGKLVVAAKCRGRQGCKAFGETIACDSSLGEVGDPCLGKAETCAVDRKSILACAASRLAVHQACPSGKQCDASEVVACR